MSYRFSLCLLKREIEGERRMFVSVIAIKSNEIIYKSKDIT